MHFMVKVDKANVQQTLLFYTILCFYSVYWKKHIIWPSEPPIPTQTHNCTLPVTQSESVILTVQSNLLCSSDWQFDLLCFVSGSLSPEETLHHNLFAFISPQQCCCYPDPPPPPPPWYSGQHSTYVMLTVYQMDFRWFLVSNYTSSVIFSSMWDSPSQKNDDNAKFL